MIETMVAMESEGTSSQRSTLYLLNERWVCSSSEDPTVTETMGPIGVVDRSIWKVWIEDDKHRFANGSS